MHDACSKVRVKENPNCWLCRNGTVISAANSFTEFIDTASVSCKLDLKPGSMECLRNYTEKNQIDQVKPCD